MNDPGKKKKVWWFEPRWSYWLRLKAELAAILRFTLWFRVAVVSLLLTGLLATLVKRYVPDLEFDWFVALAKSFSVFVGMALFIGALFCIPPMITVNRHGIVRQHGQSVCWCRRADIRSIILDTSDRAHPLIRVEVAAKTIEAGIAPKVSPAGLTDFLRTMFPELSIMERRF